jgi:hypothetical protein
LNSFSGVALSVFVVESGVTSFGFVEVHPED